MKPKVLFRGKPATRWTYQQQTNAWKVTGGDERDSVASGK
jgi:hypothetical protein